MTEIDPIEVLRAGDRAGEQASGPDSPTGRRILDQVLGTDRAPGMHPQPRRRAHTDSGRAVDTLLDLEPNSTGQQPDNGWRSRAPLLMSTLALLIAAAAFAINLSNTGTPTQTVANDPSAAASQPATDAPEPTATAALPTAEQPESPLYARTGAVQCYSDASLEPTIQLGATLTGPDGEPCADQWLETLAETGPGTEPGPVPPLMQCTPADKLRLIVMPAAPGGCDAIGLLAAEPLSPTDPFVVLRAALDAFTDRCQTLQATEAEARSRIDELGLALTIDLGPQTTVDQPCATFESDFSSSAVEIYATMPEPDGEG